MDKYPTQRQESAGGVVYRHQNGQVDIVIIAVGDDERRWQLPKGLVMTPDLQHQSQREKNKCRLQNNQ